MEPGSPPAVATTRTAETGGLNRLGAEGIVRLTAAST